MSNPVVPSLGTFPLGAARTREDALNAALADLRALAAAIASTR